MNALLKKIVMVAVVMLTTACGHMGAITGGAVGAHYGGVPGAAVGAGIGSVIDEHGVTHRGRVVSASGARRPGRCDPPQADELMAWATELDNPYQRRTARATNSNGRTSCSSSETAGSGTGVDPRRNNTHQLYAPRVGVGPAPVYGR